MEKVLTSLIAAAYWGAEILCKNTTYTMRSIYNSYQPASLGLINLKDSSPTSRNILECQLILKPLSEITYRDATGVAMIIYEREPSEQQLKAAYGFVGTITHPHTDVFELRGACWVKIIDFLRSRSYDVGYGEISSLIEAGIAININSNKG